MEFEGIKASESGEMIVLGGIGIAPHGSRPGA